MGLITTLLQKIFGKLDESNPTLTNIRQQVQTEAVKQVEQVDIKSSTIEALEIKSERIAVTCEEEFNKMLEQDKCILFLQHDWSAVDILSRRLVFMLLADLNLPIKTYKVDCSDEDPIYITDWCMSNTFQKGGWGETILLNKGSIADFIRCPAKLGEEKTKEKLIEWASL